MINLGEKVINYRIKTKLIIAWDNVGFNNELDKFLKKTNMRPDTLIDIKYNTQCHQEKTNPHDNDKNYHIEYSALIIYKEII